MLTHIVWWTLQPQAEGKSAAENAAQIKRALLDLKGRIPELKDLRVGDEFASSTTEAVELVLVTRHDDAEGLAAYAAHPEHQKVVELIKRVVASRKAIDFFE